MALTSPIDGTELRVGDIINVTGGSQGSAMFINLKVVNLDIVAEHLDNSGGTEGFAPDDPYWHFYLVERPKKPLPTHFGAKVVVEGEEYIYVGGIDAYPWTTASGEWYSTEEMEAKDWKEA